MLTTQMIGNKIAEARKKINISQAQLAQHLFISPQAVGKWERGESLPDIITLNRLAEILEVDLNYFSESMQTIATETAATEPSALQVTDPASSYALPMTPVKQKKKLSWDMSQGNWREADFSGLKNLHEKFSGSNLQRCLFMGSDMSGLLLKGNNVDTCDFSGSDFSNSHIQGSNLSKDLFNGCSLKETEFTGSHLTGCDFTDADLTGVVLKSGGFEKNTITNARWNRTSFIDTYIADIVFDGTLEDCYFDSCSFTRVTFQNSMLINTFFKNTRLKRIRFIECKADKLTYAFLKNGKADLTGITLLT